MGIGMGTLKAEEAGVRGNAEPESTQLSPGILGECKEVRGTGDEVEMRDLPQ